MFTCLPPEPVVSLRGEVLAFWNRLERGRACRHALRNLPARAGRALLRQLRAAPIERRHQLGLLRRRRLHRASCSPLVRVFSRLRFFFEHPPTTRGTRGTRGTVWDPSLCPF